MMQALPNVKNIIAIASGKGGVGKSTLAANLALALQAQGARVGLLDADIYGPSQPTMMGSASLKPDSPDGKSVQPLVVHGLQTMSIGYLVEASDQPMVWRGPMVTSALMQLLTQTLWDKLDFLLIDLPPGTGDIQLTLSQKIPVNGAVIVTTPQDIACIDARKGLQMFNKVKVPVLGIVENMSTHICTHCGHADAIFGVGGGESMAKEYNVRLLGQIPLAAEIRAHTDAGKPTVAADPDGPLARAYLDVATAMKEQLALQPKNYASKFPKIVIEN